MRYKCLIGVAGLAFGLVACTTSPTGRTQLTLMPEAQMDSMGLQAFQDLKDKTPKEADPKLNAYVSCVADKVTAELGADGGAWEVVLFKDPAVNAFALPGGHIGVYTGLLTAAKNQDQLAAVLGHEVAHVLARHGNERVSTQLATEQAAALIGAWAGGQDPSKRTMVMGLLGVGAQVGVLLPFSRIQESEADRIGLAMMARAGFDPRQSVNLWENMAQAGGSASPEFLSTHPSHKTRISDLRAHMAEVMPLYEAARSNGKQPRCGGG